MYMYVHVYYCYCWLDLRSCFEVRALMAEGRHHLIPHPGHFLVSFLLSDGLFPLSSSAEVNKVY